ncbi:MAG: PP2C family protein-serine/threonine phosphatase [bacterium]|jgi:sigma-B regulation protein RsbU (phosphoserine phosphatase)
MSDKKLLLIVDDEEEIRENLADFAEYSGFDVLQAGHGREALELVESSSPNLIISDLMMPQMNGLELLQEIVNRKLDIPVIIMTAFGTMEYAIDAMKKGAADFIAKPIDLPYMMKVVNKVLSHSEMELKLKEHQKQIEEDLRHAATIQQCLLPEPIDTDYLSLIYRFEPLIAIGGDYLTVYKYSDKSIAVALYDVSGHGISAALTANLVHNYLQSHLSKLQPPSQVITLLNEFISNQIGGTSMFLTLIIAVIDLETGVMKVCNAGHPDLLLWKSKDCDIQSVRSLCTPVGFTMNMLGDVRDVTLPLESGDRIVFYTDGIIESRNAEGKMLKREGLMQMIHKHCTKPRQAFLDSMFIELKNYHSDDMEDDCTMVLVDIK